MGPIADSHLLDAGDARWNEKLAASILIVGIVAIGIAPFWLNELIEPGTAAIMAKLNGL
jgi:NADH-quinone oxidoreductase subunit M